MDFLNQIILIDGNNKYYIFKKIVKINYMLRILFSKNKLKKQ